MKIIGDSMEKFLLIPVDYFFCEKKVFVWHYQLHSTHLSLKFNTQVPICIDKCEFKSIQY